MIRKRPKLIKTEPKYAKNNRSKNPTTQKAHLKAPKIFKKARAGSKKRSKTSLYSNNMNESVSSHSGDPSATSIERPVEMSDKSEERKLLDSSQDIQPLLNYAGQSENTSNPNFKQESLSIKEGTSFADHNMNQKKNKIEDAPDDSPETPIDVVNENTSEDNRLPQKIEPFSAILQEEIGLKDSPQKARKNIESISGDFSRIFSEEIKENPIELSGKPQKIFRLQRISKKQGNQTITAKDMIAAKQSSEIHDPDSSFKTDSEMESSCDQKQSLNSGCTMGDIAKGKKIAVLSTLRANAVPRFSGIRVSQNEFRPCNDGESIKTSKFKSHGKNSESTSRKASMISFSLGNGSNYRNVDSPCCAHRPNLENWESPGSFITKFHVKR
ncbi:unnamed protein product [Moneuplotes crassus]|uniref:Uncharacterized protein n=1 Tax=Euplotes crassus TaxID=5936 RepID=A0AAD1Y432_EUPCR|nr:unnamed protein product [Moneuplotes crassus]